MPIEGGPVGSPAHPLDAVLRVGLEANPDAEALVLTDDRAPIERLTDEGVTRESRALLSE